MRTFKVIRTEDVSGISGTGVVAEGVEFHDGQCAISWFGRHQIVEIAADIKTWIIVHGHGGRTTIQWDQDKWTKFRSFYRKFSALKRR